MVHKLKCLTCGISYYNNMLQSANQNNIQCLKCANEQLKDSFESLRHENAALRVQMQQLIEVVQSNNSNNTPASPSFRNLISRFLPASPMPTGSAPTNTIKTPISTPTTTTTTPNHTRATPKVSDTNHFPALSNNSRGRSHGQRVTPAPSTPSRTTEMYAVPTSNAFNALIDLVNDHDEDETVGDEDETENHDKIIEVISDSLGRNLGKHLGNTNRKVKRTVNVHPGAKIDYIEKKVRSHKPAAKKSHLVILVGSNDVYDKDAASEVIIEKYSVLLDSIKDRSNTATVIGVLPRMKANNYSLSRAIRINNSIKKMCDNANVGFLDLWDNYVYNHRLFKSDGVHINSQGLDILASKIIKQTALQQKIFC